MSNESKLIPHPRIIDFLWKKITKWIFIDFLHSIMDILDILPELLSSYTKDRLILQYFLGRKDSQFLYGKSFDEDAIFLIRTWAFMWNVTIPAIKLPAYSILLQARTNINLTFTLSTSTPIIALIIIKVKYISRF